LVLRPDSDFFRFFGDPMGKSPPAGTNTAAPAVGPAAAANPTSASSTTK
jgi:hypothetical protein